MTEPTPPSPPDLSYQSATPRPSALLQATWIMLLIIGCLHLLAGFCSAGSFLMMLVLWGRAAAAPSTGAPASSGPLAIIWIVMVGSLALLLLLGATYVFCSLKIRRRSRAAVITSMILIGVQLLVVMAIVGLGVWSLIAEEHHADAIALLITFLVYAIAGAALAVMEFLLFKTRRELVSPYVRLG